VWPAVRVAVSQAWGAERPVSPLELFFDLVYVVSLAQISHHLQEYVDLRTGVETLILALAVFYGWYMTMWGANGLDPDRLSVRLLLVGLMFAALLMSAAIGDAFEGRAWLFITGYLLLQIGRSAFLIVRQRGQPLGEQLVNILVWELLAGALWLTGASTDGDARLVLWGLAVVVAYAGGLTQHWLPGRGQPLDLAHTHVAGGLLVERFRLFFIILLGETVLTMGNTLADEPFDLERLASLLIGFTATVALWWCYFHRSEGFGARAAETTDGARSVGWWGTWTLALIVLGVIAIAVADEMAIADPGGDATLGFTILTFGGPALFLIAQFVFARAALGRMSRSRSLGLAALAALAVATAPLTLIIGVASSTAVLVAVAIADTVRHQRSHPWLAVVCGSDWKASPPLPPMGSTTRPAVASAPSRSPSTTRPTRTRQPGRTT
jgi:low temperature requirement protein LtrA